MRPRERRETGEQDLFRARLDQIIDMKHSLVKLAHAIDWRFLEGQFGVVYTNGSGRPPLPTRRTGLPSASAARFRQLPHGSHPRCAGRPDFVSAGLE
jgi:IS5 family transposase